MRGEFFRVIRDYPNYEVSNYGRVRNTANRKFLAMFRNNTNGWYFVCLYRDRRQRTIPVHRLVAEAFLEVPQNPNLSIVQRDGDRSNNHVDNLIWKPRWFAVMYMREMSDEHYHRPDEIEAQRTQELFDSVAHVASVVMQLPSKVFEGIYGEHPISYPHYGVFLARTKNLSYTQTIRGL